MRLRGSRYGSTGTGVKAIECLLFMRNIESAAYFEQMKGRGVRVISSDDLAARTPDSAGKDRFVIVDAVGVCERDKTHSKPLAETTILGIDACFPDSVVGFVPSKSISVRYVQLQLQAVRKRIESMASATAQKNINLEVLYRKAIGTRHLSRRWVQRWSN